MKITEIEGGGLGVSALIAVAAKLHDETEACGYTLVVIDPDDTGVLDTLAVVSSREFEAGSATLAATVEPNPRLLHFEADADG
jgi:hypothetical protein